MTEAKAQSDNTRKRQGDTLFRKGQSGNPHGRPRGSRNKTTLAVESLLDGQAEALTQKAVDMAMEGDIQALRICMDRIAPPRKDSPIYFDIPKLEGAADIVTATRAVVEAAAGGHLTLSETSELSKIIQSFGKAVETADLEERIRRLEEGMKQ